MREITKYHDTSKTVKERAKNKLFGAVYSHTAIILLLILLQIGIMEPNIWVPDWRSFEWRLNLICSRMNMSSMR